MGKDGLVSFVKFICELIIKAVCHGSPVEVREQHRGMGCHLPPCGLQELNSGSILAANAFTHQAVSAPVPSPFRLRQLCNIHPFFYPAVSPSIHLPVHRLASPSLSHICLHTPRSVYTCKLGSAISRTKIRNSPDIFSIVGSCQ